MAEKSHEEQLKEQQDAQREREARQRTAAAQTQGANDPHNSQAEKDRQQAAMDKSAHATPGVTPKLATHPGPLRPASFGEGAAGVLPYVGDTAAPRVGALWLSEVLEILEHSATGATGERADKLKALIESGKASLEGK
jgi:hypothetical protein